MSLSFRPLDAEDNDPDDIRSGPHVCGLFLPTCPLPSSALIHPPRRLLSFALSSSDVGASPSFCRPLTSRGGRSNSWPPTDEPGRSHSGQPCLAIQLRQVTLHVLQTSQDEGWTECRDPALWYRGVGAASYRVSLGLCLLVILRS